jgi:predicted amidohydrolase YtcJ
LRCSVDPRYWIGTGGRTGHCLYRCHGLDGTGAAPVKETVLVQNGRITAVGPKLKLPAGTKKVAAQGKALVPGFFDVHTHWTPGGSPDTTPQIATAYVQSGITTVNDFHQQPEPMRPAAHGWPRLWRPM